MNTPLAQQGCNSVLVVEDEADIRESVTELLEYEGYHVVAAVHGKEAFEILPSMPTPCLILLDLMMPIMDGWEFSQQLSQDPAFAEIPVVIVSAFSDKAREVRCQGVVKKPIDVDFLLSTVKRFCSGDSLLETKSRGTNIAIVI